MMHAFLLSSFPTLQDAGVKLFNSAASCLYTAACQGYSEHTSGSASSGTITGTAAIRQAAVRAGAVLDTAQKLWQKEFRLLLPACVEVAALAKVEAGNFVPGKKGVGITQLVLRRHSAAWTLTYIAAQPAAM